MINNKIKIGLLGILGAVLLFSASCDPNKKYEEKEQDQIDYYLSSNPLLEFNQLASGLYYLDVVVGTGPAPVTNDSVFVFATGMYLDGTTFWSNIASGLIYGFPCDAGENITGFDEAIMKMKQGGKASVIIPSSLAYGPDGNAWIPGWKPLLYDIELVRVKSSSGK